VPVVIYFYFFLPTGERCGLYYTTRPHVAAYRGEVAYIYIICSTASATCKRRKKTHRDRIREKNFGGGRAAIARVRDRAPRNIKTFYLARHVMRRSPLSANGRVRAPKARTPVRCGQRGEGCSRGGSEEIIRASERDARIQW